MEKKVLLAGEPMGLFIAQEPGALEDVSRYAFAVAGAEFNVAVGLARLGHTAVYVTRLGEDPFGRHIEKVMKENGISTREMQFSAAQRTGFMLKSRVEKGDPSIFYFRAGSAASNLSPADAEQVDLDGAALLHLTGITPALSEGCLGFCRRLVARAKAAGLAFSFDPNLRPQLWCDETTMRTVIEEFAAQADLFLPGIAEARRLWGCETAQEAAAWYRAHGTGCVVVKTGADGAWYSSPEGEGQVPGFRVRRVVDTVGAGDGFAAGVLSARLEGLSWPEAVRRGNAVGAIQVMSEGDNDGLPTRERLEAFMRGEERQ